jgi:hypothetical protein
VRTVRAKRGQSELSVDHNTYDTKRLHDVIRSIARNHRFLTTIRSEKVRSIKNKFQDVEFIL